MSERSLLEGPRADLASTAFWYQEAPGGRARADPSIDQLEVGSAP